jgi:drug/metabolite transporter (DMT)-like permease
MFTHLTPAFQAILLAVFAYASFSVADALAKLMTHTYSVVVCLTVPAALALTANLAYILARRGPSGFKTAKIKLHLLRGVLITLMAYLVVNALTVLPLPAFYSIVFIIPFVVSLLSVLILKERLALYRLAVIATAFLGVLIIVKAQFATAGTGVLMVLLVVFLSSINVFVMRRIGQHEYLPLYGFFPFLGIVLTGLPETIPALPSIPLADWGLFGIYALALLAGHTAIPLAFSVTPEISLIAPFHYTQMLWGIMFGVLLFGQTPSPSTLLGASLIIGAGLYMFWRERHHVKRKPKAT